MKTVEGFPLFLRQRRVLYVLTALLLFPNAVAITSVWSFSLPGAPAYNAWRRNLVIGYFRMTGKEITRENQLDLAHKHQLPSHVAMVAFLISIAYADCSLYRMLSIPRRSGGRTWSRSRLRWYLVRVLLGLAIGACLGYLISRLFLLLL